MQLRDNFLLAFKALKDRRLRSALTVLGIVIGAAMVVALVASVGGLTASVTAQISKMGATTLTVNPTSARTLITDVDVGALRDLGGVAEVIPFYSRRLTINYGSTSVSVNLFGLDQDRLFSLYKGIELDRGGLVDMYDPTGTVVGAYVASPPEGSLPSYDLDELLTLEGTSTGRSRAPSYSFLIRGVLEPFGVVGFTDIDNSIFMSQMGAQILFKLSSYSGLYVIASTPEDVSSVTVLLQEYFGQNARIMSAQFILGTVQSITSQLTMFMGGIAAVSLFVAGVGITNTMFVSVMERTREIGIMKALGFKPKDILRMFLVEASLTGMLGGCFGTVTGVLIAYLLGGAMPRIGGGGSPMMGGRTTLTASFSPTITMPLLIFSLLFPIGISVIAGLYPAWRGSRLNTVLALKYE